jgi:hypothetical protein
MLGRKDYTREEVANAEREVKQLLSTYRKLAKAVQETSDPKATAALEAFEPVLFNSMALALDRRFVHRLRSVTGKDGNPINELEMLSDSLMNNDGVLRGINAIKYKAEDSVLKLDVGDAIQLDAEQFQRLSKKFFGDLETKYVK